MPPRVKVCRKCAVEQGASAFYAQSASVDGLQSYCKSCSSGTGSENHAARRREPGYTEAINTKQRVYRKDNPERATAWDRTKRYGLTPQAFDAMLAAQGGVCAICKRGKPQGSVWHVDHDHSCCDTSTTCGQCVRGILCHHCNVRVLPTVEHDGHLIEAALSYLTLGNGSTSR